MTRKHLLLIVIVLVLPLALSQDCSTASVADCGKAGSSCQYYVVNNGSCVAPTTCPSLTVWLNASSNCIQCGKASEQVCSICATTYNFYFNTNQNLCTTCAATYGQLCVTCNSSQCQTCSSGYVLASNNQSCASKDCDVEYCLDCITPSTCRTCDSVYVLFSGKCICSVANCEFCGAGICKKCFEGYDLDASKTKCNFVCIDNCDTCTDLNSCDSCAVGYSYDSSVNQCKINCQAISPFCLSCTSTTFCSSCRAGYRVSFSGTTCNVQCADSKCTTCATTSNCTQCSAGFYRTLNSTTGNYYCATDICQISYCSKCASTTTCETCIDLFITNTAKTQCIPNCNIPNCAVCASSTTCQSCNDGFRVSSNTCVPICSIPNCQLCATTATCLRCKDSFVLASNRQSCDFNCNIEGCISCASSTTCATCYLSTLSSDKKRCVVTCREGFFLNSTTNACQSCPADTCRSCDSLGKCLVCVDLYYLNSTNFACVACSTIANCFDCSPSRAQCRTCNSGYDLINNVCVDQSSCTVANCKTCSTSTICSLCQNGYSLTTGTCSQIVCPGNQYVDPDTNICTCGSKLFFINGVCTVCTDTNCLLCSSSACSSCVKGYYPSGSSCVNCGSNCEVCDSTGCTTCREGFTLNSGLCKSPTSTKVTSVANNGDIINCDTGCKVCDLDSATPPNAICRSAQDGYALVSGKIYKCSSSCLTCATTPNASTGEYSICLTCPSGSNFNAGTCSRCTDTNAITCRNRNPAYSLSCKPGYNAESGTCKPCASNCLKCGNAKSGDCDQGGCATGFFQSKSFSACVKCFNGCQVCDTDPNVCLKCGDYKYLSNNVCFSCSQKCMQCKSATNCTTCDVGYLVASDGSCRSLTIKDCVDYDANFICIKCDHNYVLSSNGLTCTISQACNATSTCDLCKMGYYLSKSQCFDCPTLPNCTYCNIINKNLCISCNKGYYSDAGVCKSCGKIGCETCTSDVDCTDAQDGYYLQLDISGDLTGGVLQCGGLCATCIDSDLSCLTCQSGATLVGSSCISKNNFDISIVAGVVNLISGASSDYELGVLLSVTSRFLNEMALKVLKFSSFSKFQANSLMRSIKQGSLVVSMAVNQDALTQNNVDANTAVSTAKFTDVAVLSHSIVTNIDTASSVNLGLVLGVSIPLGILLVAIIIILKVKSDKTDEESGLDGTEKGIQYQAELF